MKVAIIGGGLAGAAAAYFLNQYDTDCILYESGPNLACCASGNFLGLYNPRLSAAWSDEAQFYGAAFALALEIFPQLEDVGWWECGALHLMTDEKRRVRYEKMAESWPWGEGMARLVDAGEASALAGVDISQGALYLPRSGIVSPEKLCAAYARGSEVRFGARIQSLGDIDADVVVLACGGDVAAFDEGAHLPLSTVRGQVTMARASPVSAPLKAALCYGGYCAPAVDGVHMVGASFQRWLSHTDILPEDDADNLMKLGAVVPGLIQGMEVSGSRAALRCTAPDHFPVIGRLSERVYVSAAHGSHGILSSLMGAQLLAEMILGKPLSLPDAVMNKLSPARFEASFPASEGVLNL